MRGKSMVLIVIALGCGLVASIGISQILDRGGSSNAPKTNTKKVYVAAKDVDIGQVFDAEEVKLEEWPAEKIPEGAVTKLDDVVGWMPNQRLYEGEVIRKEKLVDPAKGGGSSTLIPKGYRVQAVRVKAEDTGGNLITPGDHVDVNVYLRKGGNIPQSTTKTILEDVRVFAVNSETSKQLDEDGKAINAKTVSLLVKPPQLQTLLLASRVGQISLSLRHPDDESNSGSSDGASLADVLNGRGEDATPNNDKKYDAPTTVAAKSAATDFKSFLDGLNGLKAKPAENDTPPEPVAQLFKMELLTRDGIQTWELEDTDQFSKAKVVPGSFGGLGANLPPATDPSIAPTDPDAPGTDPDIPTDDFVNDEDDLPTDGDADDAGDADSTTGSDDSDWDPNA